jgi:citrate synthase
VSDEEVFANSRLNREQVNVDLRAVKPSFTSIKVIDKDQKKIKYQSQQLLDKIESAKAKEKWHRDMQVFERVKGLLDTP